MTTEEGLREIETALALKWREEAHPPRAVSDSKRLETTGKRTVS